MLYLIGLGFDEKDVSLRSIEIARNSECFAELYTNAWEGDLSKIEEIIDKKIEVLDRKGVEEEFGRILEISKEKNAVLFVSGDPLVATTHIELIIQAKNKDIPFKVIHNTSILTAISETGLQLYKFGKIVSLPGSGITDSFKEGIENNKKIGLHSLILLDIDMDLKSGVKALINSGIVDKDEKIVGANFGKETYIIYKKAEEIEDTLNPAVVIIPGKLHFKEEEYLEMLK